MTPRLVVDASVVLKWLLPEAERERARALLSRYADGDVVLLGPAHLRLEVAGTLVRYNRRKTITSDETRRLFRMYERVTPQLVPTEELAGSAMELAIAHQFSVWDSVYLALALAEGCPLITVDLRFFRTAALSFPCMRYLGGAIGRG